MMGVAVISLERDWEAEPPSAGMPLIEGLRGPLCRVGYDGFSYGIRECSWEEHGDRVRTLT